MSTKLNTGKLKLAGLTFESLVGSIRAAHDELVDRAGRAVNISLTLRNWLIGFYIAEYELRGADRSKYGDKLLEKLSLELETLGVSSCGRRQLYQYLRFYQMYPQIVRSVTSQFPSLVRPGMPGVQKVRSATAQFTLLSDDLVRLLSYTHIEQLLGLEDPLARVFYERECLRGGWSVRELKRQIASLYFERSHLSRDKKKLAAVARRGAEKAPPRLDVRDPYVFEFLGPEGR
jgi:hypothetical protein